MAWDRVTVWCPECHEQTLVTHFQGVIGYFSAHEICGKCNARFIMAISVDSAP